MQPLHTLAVVPVRLEPRVSHGVTRQRQRAHLRQLTRPVYRAVTGRRRRETVAGDVLEKVEAEVEDVFALLHAVGELVLEEEPVVDDGEEEHVAGVQRWVQQAVGPQRQTQQRDEQRRAVPAGDAVYEDAAFAVLQQRVQHEQQVVLRELVEVPLLVGEPVDVVDEARRDVEPRVVPRVLPVEAQAGADVLVARVHGEELAARVGYAVEVEVLVAAAAVDLLGRGERHAELHLAFLHHQVEDVADFEALQRGDVGASATRERVCEGRKAVLVLWSFSLRKRRLRRCVSESRHQGCFTVAISACVLFLTTNTQC